MNKVVTFFVTVIAAVFTTCGVGIAHQYYEVAHQPVVPTIPEMLGSVVQVHIGDHGLCSGWVLKGTTKILTDAHCAGEQPGIDQLTISFPNEAPEYVAHIVKLGDSDGTFAPDLLILETNTKVANLPTGLPLCSGKTYYGEFAAFLGSPLGVGGSTLYGYVSKPSTDLSDLGTFFEKDYIQMDAKMLPGNSGGPLVDMEEGCVIGMADFIRIVNPEVDVAYGNNYATSAATINDFLNTP